MDINELRECTDDRLSDLEKTLRREIFDARMKNFTNQLDDTASIRRARRNLARVKTVLSERLLSADESPAEADGDVAEETTPESAPEGEADEAKEGTE